MRRFVDLCRLVSNKTLALFEAGEKKLGYAGLCKLFTEWQNSLAWRMCRFIYFNNPSII